MNRTLKRLALPLGAAAILGTSGFAFMANGYVQNSHASDGTGTVIGYATYDVHFVGGGTGGNIGYVHFNSIPQDNSHDTSSWPSSGSVTFPDGNTYSCTFAWSGDTRTNSYTDTYSSATGVADHGSPQASWVCDVRGAGAGEDPAASNVTFKILS